MAEAADPAEAPLSAAFAGLHIDTEIAIDDNAGAATTSALTPAPTSLRSTAIHAGEVLALQAWVERFCADDLSSRHLQAAGAGTKDEIRSWLVDELDRQFGVTYPEGASCAALHKSVKAVCDSGSFVVFMFLSYLAAELAVDMDEVVEVKRKHSVLQLRTHMPPVPPTDVSQSSSSRRGTVKFDLQAHATEGEFVLRDLTQYWQRVEQDVGRTDKNCVSALLLTAERRAAQANYKTGESTVHLYVHQLIVDLLVVLGLNGVLFVENNTQVDNLRPDLMLFRVTLDNLPIGIVEVKTDSEDVEEGRSNSYDVFNSSDVVGQVHDYLMQLRTQYKMTSAFAVLTTYARARVYWLGDELTDSIASANTSAGTQESASLGTHMPNPSPRARVSTSRVQDSPAQGAAVLATSAATSSTVPPAAGDEDLIPQLKFSKIFSLAKCEDKDQGPDSLRAMATALLCMCEIRVESSPVAFQDDGAPFAGYAREANATSLRWCKHTLPTGFHFGELPAQNTKNFWLWYVLGYGVSGRSVLATTKSGTVCVLKLFDRVDGEASQIAAGRSSAPAELELQRWQTAYEGKKWSESMWVTRVANCKTLVMPYFSPVCPADRLRLLPEVEKVLRDNFHSKRLMHCDVRWRHVAQYCSVGKEQSIVVLDLGLMVDDYTGDDSWVVDAIKNLRERAVPGPPTTPEARRNPKLSAPAGKRSSPPGAVSPRSIPTYSPDPS